MSITASNNTRMTWWLGKKECWYATCTHVHLLGDLSLFRKWLGIHRGILNYLKRFLNLKN